MSSSIFKKQGQQHIPSARRNGEGEVSSETDNIFDSYFIWALKKLHQNSNFREQ